MKHIIYLVLWAVALFGRFPQHYYDEDPRFWALLQIGFTLALIVVGIWWVVAEVFDSINFYRNSRYFDNCVSRGINPSTGRPYPTLEKFKSFHDPCPYGNDECPTCNPQEG